MRECRNSIIIIAGTVPGEAQFWGITSVETVLWEKNNRVGFRFMWDGESGGKMGHFRWMGRDWETF